MKVITKIGLLVCLLSASLLIGCNVTTDSVGELKDYAVEGGLYTGTCEADGTPTGIGTIEYDNGNIYEGPVKNGKPEGEGVMIDAVTEATYTGAFVNGLYSDAAAVLEFDNGGLYEGAFADGKMKGEGVFTWPAGDVFVGVFNGTGGKEGSAGAIDATGVLTYVTGIVYEGTLVTGAPAEGKFSWPANGPEYEGVFTGFLTGYGDLDMKNGINYHGPMGAGLLVPVDSWTEIDQKVVITYPVNDVYDGEVFEGSYVYNAEQNKDELIGTITYKDGVTVIENVKVMLDFSFSYRYTGTLELPGVTYVGEMRDHQVPYGAGVYTWAGGPVFTAVESHGWLTGYGTLDMKNGIVYTGPLNAIQMSVSGGTEFQPYITISGQIIDEVTVVHPAGVFTGKLELLGLENITDVSVRNFYAGATYLSVGKFKDVNQNDIDFLFVPSFQFGLFPIITTAPGVPVNVGGLNYEGRYIIVNGLNIPFGAGQLYWVAKDANPYLQSDFFFCNTTGLVTFSQVGYKYVGGMSEGFVFGPATGISEASVIFDDGRVFTGAWVNGVLTGIMTYVDGTTEQGTIAITLTTCDFVKGE